MVIPFWLWARKELAKEGITDGPEGDSHRNGGVPLTVGIDALV